ncbi:hypothetical protein K431DRAFT_136038 [Polychaeton citri CBS 116435]|uniref:Zn(2)-C6 fungal-type domain-containing protein n=1 Tax=Polychaeton citri CBS 116435 TaxID=1314669 RepID=A0A9P4UN06_9PEZI|nr:hypothetical protein K431DRAFT_136038 [Polychaeton citri CBS 116435]
MAENIAVTEAGNSSAEPPGISSAQRIDGNTGFRKFTAKRRNVTRACDSCRSKKRRCTGDQPCGACRPYGSRCTYDASYTRGRVPQTLPHSPEGAALSHSSNAPCPVMGRSGAPADSIIRPAYLASSDASANHGIYLHSPYITDTGAGAGARLTFPEMPRGASPDDDDVELAGQYVGKASAYSFLQHAWKKFGKDVPDSQIPGNTLNADDGNIFSAGDKKFTSREYGEIELPEQPTTAALVSLYFEFAMPTYRFLHEPTIREWLKAYPALHVSINPNKLGLSPAQQAILLTVLATAFLFQKDAPQPEIRILKFAPHESEKLFQAAQAVLASETGRPTLESAQARLASCMYLVMTSRPNQSWYMLGMTVQLIIACGFHRRKPLPTPVQDELRLECEKRVFWVVYTFDMYMSVMFGRPALIQDDFVDQEFPAAVNDDDLTTAGIDSRGETRDSYTTASVLHAKLARITKKASQQQQNLHRSRRLDNMVVLNTELDQWQKTLPVILSGMIHPSSLVPIFRRQYAVLQLGYSHAVMLVNRSLLLGGYKKPTSAQQHISTCMLAAKSTLDSILALVTERHMYPSLWLTQYVAFTALSVVYVWLVQRSQDRVPRIITLNERDLLRHAEKVQGHLADATNSNAPSLRYSIILEGLQEEARRCVGRLDSSASRIDGILSDAPPKDATGGGSDSNTAEEDVVNVDFAFDPELWQQLDGFPFSEFDLGTTSNPNQYTQVHT